MKFFWNKNKSTRKKNIEKDDGQTDIEPTQSNQLQSSLICEVRPSLITPIIRLSRLILTLLQCIFFIGVWRITLMIIPHCNLTRVENEERGYEWVDSTAKFLPTQSIFKVPPLHYPSPVHSLLFTSFSNISLQVELINWARKNMNSWHFYKQKIVSHIYNS